MERKKISFNLCFYLFNIFPDNTYSLVRNDSDYAKKSLFLL